MAQIIKIKRSTGSTAPGTLNAGELAFRVPGAVLPVLLLILII